MTYDHPDSTRRFESALAGEEGQGGTYILRLYVAGATPRSRQAIENIKVICEEHLKGRYDLEVIDIYQQPVLLEGEQIIAVPTLVKRLPAPLRKLIGDMSDTGRVLVGLDIRPKKGRESKDA
ncbi:MAG: circadian clock KaiB family protein [Pseudomonadota bacterium]